MAGIVVPGCGRTTPTSDRAGAHYVVTATAIDVGVGSGICVAVDPDDSRGVWWWQPGSDCSTRTTGPGVFRGEEAAVSRRSDATEIRFRIQVHGASKPPGPSYVDVQLTAQDTWLRSMTTNSKVGTVMRRDLEIPEMWR